MHIKIKDFNCAERKRKLGAPKRKEKKRRKKNALGSKKKETTIGQKKILLKENFA